MKASNQRHHVMQIVAALDSIVYTLKGERQLSRDCYPQELSLLLERIREIAASLS
jgi:hypothetical protein